MILFGIPARPVEIDVAEALIFKNLNVLAAERPAHLRDLVQDALAARERRRRPAAADHAPLPLEGSRRRSRSSRPGEACKIVLFPGPASAVARSGRGAGAARRPRDARWRTADERWRSSSAGSSTGCARPARTSASTRSPRRRGRWSRWRGAARSSSSPRTTTSAWRITRRWSRRDRGPPPLRRRDGVGAVHLRHVRAHLALEARARRFLGTEAAYLRLVLECERGAIPSLTDHGTVILSDELNHATASSTRSASRARAKSDLQALRHGALREGSTRCEPEQRKLVITDGVFSMEGDLARLPDIVALAREYDAVVLVDDSHGTGVMGATGRGVAEHFGLLGEVDVITSTLGKALGGAAGGFVAAARPSAISSRSARARSSSRMPSRRRWPAARGGRAGPRRRACLVERLRDRRTYFRRRLGFGFHPLHGEAAISRSSWARPPLRSSLSRRLLEEGVFVTGFGFPVVPEGRRACASRCRPRSRRAHGAGADGVREARQGAGAAVSSELPNRRDRRHRLSPGHRMHPVRYHLGISAFGANAWTVENVGDRLMPEHEEDAGSEELYVVLRGRARFEIGGESVDSVPGRARLRGAAHEPGPRCRGSWDNGARDRQQGRKGVRSRWVGGLGASTKRWYEAGEYEAVDRDGPSRSPTRTRSTAPSSTTLPAARRSPAARRTRSATSASPSIGDQACASWRGKIRISIPCAKTRPSKSWSPDGGRVQGLEPRRPRLLGL